MRINLLDGNGGLVASKAVRTIDEAREFIKAFAELLGYQPVPVIEYI